MCSAQHYHVKSIVFPASSSPLSILSVMPLPSLSPPLTTSTPSPSNLISVQWNNTSNGTDHDGHSICCEPETMLVISLSTAFGFLLSLLLILIFCTFILCRRAKRHHTRGLQQTNCQSTGRVSLPYVLSLRASSYSGDSSLTEQSNDKGDSNQQPSSPYEITPNPSYCSTTAFLDSRSRSPDDQSVHQYDDIINFPRKDEDISGVYDRLEPTLASLDTHNYENSALKLLQRQCTLTSSAPPATVSTSPSSYKVFDCSPIHYVNGPLPAANFRPKPPSTSFCAPNTNSTPSTVHWKRQCKTLTKHSGPREYEVPITRNHTFKW